MEGVLNTMFMNALSAINCGGSFKYHVVNVLSAINCGVSFKYHVVNVFSAINCGGSFKYHVYECVLRDELWREF